MGNCATMNLPVISIQLTPDFNNAIALPLSSGINLRLDNYSNKFRQIPVQVLLFFYILYRILQKLIK